MQDRIKFNDTDIVQPDEGGYSAILATTSTEDSDRSISGKMHNTPLFTVLGYNLKWSRITAAEASKILQHWVGKSKCKVHYFDIMTATWKDGYFYATNFNAPSKSVKNGEECWDSLSFDVRSVDAL